MNKLILIAAAAAALAACDNNDNTVAGSANNASEVNTAGIVLPPAIAASKTYRCKDNSLVYIDWLADKVSANFRPEQTAAPIQLKAAAAGEPMTAEGYSLTGDASAATITLTRPDKGSQSCKA